jgi:ABC-type sulfate transport system substrate-binding protein
VVSAYIVDRSEPGTTAAYVTLVAMQNPYELDLWRDHLLTGFWILLGAPQSAGTADQ